VALSRVKLTAQTPATIIDPVRFREELDTVRRQGYAVDHQEQNPLVRCTAAPIKDAAGTAVAAISVSFFPAEWSPEQEREVTTALVAAATRASQAFCGAQQS